MNPRVGARVLFLAAAPALSWAQVPAGPEFRVNTYTTFNQSYPAASSAANGDFVMVWAGALPGVTGYPVFGQRYAAAGTPRGAEFRVDQGTTSTKAFPAVAAHTGGAFVVAWQGPDDGNVYGILARRYDATGGIL